MTAAAWVLIAVAMGLAIPFLVAVGWFFVAFMVLKSRYGASLALCVTAAFIPPRLTIGINAGTSPQR